MQVAPNKFLLKSSTKTAIIDLLSQEYPLKAKIIFNKLNHGINHLTYQGVHKAVKELEEEKVVVQNEEGFSLDQVWVEGLKSFALDLNENYSKKQKVDWSDDLISLHFPTILSMVQFIVGTYEIRFPNPEKKDSICVWRHAWPLVGLGEKEFNEVKELLKRSKHYTLCINSTPLDKFFSNMLESLGKKQKLNAPVTIDCDVKVHGEYIAQIYFPEEVKKEINEIYTNTTSIESFDYSDLLMKVVEKKHDILVVIQKNPTMADYFRNLAYNNYGIKVGE